MPGGSLEQSLGTGELTQDVGSGPLGPQQSYALTGVDVCDIEVASLPGRPQLGGRHVIGCELVLSADPTVEERVAQGATAVLRWPCEALPHVEHPAVHRVRVRRRHEQLARAGRGSGLGAGQKRGPDPPAGRTGGEYCSEAAGRADATRREHRYLHRVENRLQQRQRGHLVAAVAAALTAAGDQHVNPRLLGGNRLPQRADLGRHDDAGVLQGTIHRSYGP